MVMDTQVKQDKTRNNNLLWIFGSLFLLTIGGYLAYTLLSTSSQNFDEIEGFTFKYASDMRCISGKTKGEDKPDTWHLKKGDSTKVAICTLDSLDLLTEHPEQSVLKSTLDLFAKKFPSITEQLSTYEKIDPKELKLEHVTYKEGVGKDKYENALHYISFPVKHPKGGGMYVECYCLQSNKKSDIMMLFLDKRENLAVPTQAFKKIKEDFMSSTASTTYSDGAPDLFEEIKASLT